MATEVGKAEVIPGAAIGGNNPGGGITPLEDLGEWDSGIPGGLKPGGNPPK